MCNFKRIPFKIGFLLRKKNYSNLSIDEFGTKEKN